MELNWAHIYEGWRNKLFPPHEIRKLIQQTAINRYEICKGCPLNTKNMGEEWVERCSVCGCPLTALTRCLSCKCSDKVPKWPAVLTVDQQEEINPDEEG